MKKLLTITALAVGLSTIPAQTGIVDTTKKYFNKYKVAIAATLCGAFTANVLMVSGLATKASEFVIGTPRIPTITSIKVVGENVAEVVALQATVDTILKTSYEKMAAHLILNNTLLKEVLSGAIIMAGAYLAGTLIYEYMRSPEEKENEKKLAFQRSAELNQLVGSDYNK